MKVWETVWMHKGHEIKILNNAEAGDCMDYKIEPPLSQWEMNYPTIGDAVEAIEKFTTA